MIYYHILNLPLASIIFITITNCAVMSARHTTLLSQECPLPYVTPLAALTPLDTSLLDYAPVTRYG